MAEELKRVLEEGYSLVLLRSGGEVMPMPRPSAQTKVGYAIAIGRVPMPSFSVGKSFVDCSAHAHTDFAIVKDF